MNNEQKNSASYYIRQLQLHPHPEGGYYKEVYRSTGIIPKDCLHEFEDARNYATSIYFLLEQGNFSAFHKIKSDELWHFYAGDTLLIHVIEPNGNYHVIMLGSNLDKGETFQCVVPANAWFASEPAPDAAFALVGCTVSPGFDFADFEMAEKEMLRNMFPKQANIIERLCR